MQTQKVVLYVFRRKRKERLALYNRGEGPDEMLYGYNHLDPQRFLSIAIEGNDTQWTWWHRFHYPVEVQISRVVGMGFSLHILLDNWRQIQCADIIIATVDSCGLPVAMLKFLRILKQPVIYISQGLSDRFETTSPKSWKLILFRNIYSKFLNSIDRILVLGEGAVQPLVKHLSIKPEKVSFIPFGIDREFWTLDKSQTVRDYILSVGSDLARDYNTLLNAIGNYPLQIVTRLPVLGRENQQVTVSSNFTDIELRDLYRQARFVITPLQDVAQPSGQSATLQAMACGKAVILTETKGLWDSKRMRHLENCYFVKPNDSESLRFANARTAIERFYSSEQFAVSLEHEIKKVLST